jgi:tetratricopeptide (TPR) repeat protein
MTETDDQDAALAGYLTLATLADRQMPRLGFFPPTDPEAWSTESDSTESDTGAGDLVPAGLAAQITADPVAWFTAESPRLLEITRWACGHGRYRAAARLASRQRTFQFLQHRVGDADQMWRAIEQAADQAEDIATSSEARFHLAWVMADGGRFTDAHAALDKCIPILEARGVRGTLAVALYWRAFCADMLGQSEVQRDDSERCLGLARQLREPGIEVMALRILGMALIRLGSQDCGIALCEQAVRLAQEKGELAWEYNAITTLAFALCQAGRHESAERCCQEGIEVSNRLGLFISGQAYLLGLLGDSYMGQGRYREGAKAFAQSMVEFKESGDIRGQALCLLKLGQSHIALGEPQRAAEVLQQCFPMFSELGLPAYQDAVINALDQCRTTPEVTLAEAP